MIWYKRVKWSYPYQTIGKYLSGRAHYPSFANIHNKLSDYFNRNNKIKAIQIGANDGTGADFIRQYMHHYAAAVLLEPIPVSFQRLRHNYSAVEHFILINAALDKQEGEKEIFKIAFSEARWATGLTSFDRSTLEKHLANGYVARKAAEEGINLPDKNSWISTERIRTVTFNKIIEEFDFQDVKAIYIDTEGFDFEVLRMIPFEDIHPDIICFEHSHLTPADYRDAQQLLSRHGYSCVFYGRDTMAYKQDAFHAC